MARDEDTAETVSASTSAVFIVSEGNTISMRPALKRVLSMHLLNVILVLIIATVAYAYQPASTVTRGVYVHSRDLIPGRIWSDFRAGYEFSTDSPHSGDYCIRCDNDPGTERGASQRVEVNQTEPGPLKIAGWSRAENVQSGGSPYQYSIYVDLRYTDGEPLFMQLAPFESGTHDWQYSETIIEPEKPIATASVNVLIRKIDGTVWFDDIFFGPAHGENLLRVPGFETTEMADDTRRQQVLADLETLGVNAVHTFMSLPDDAREQEELRGMLDTLADHETGVVVTVGMGYEAMENADDPDSPQLNCVNGEWGDRWIQTLRGFAEYPFMGIGVVPDEYNWNTGRLRRRFVDHADERVRELYKNLPTYCECEACQERFEREYGEPLPPMGQWSRPPEQTDAYRKFIDFRYQSTTDLIRRAADAIHATDHDIRADSLLCVSPICSDFRLGTGVAWDMVGYHTDLEYPTTDPYILLHNYRGDSTHWYVTETAAHLVGSTPRRQCGIVLEGTQLRPDHRSLLPAEIYGSALSAVARGAREVAFFHYVHLMQETAAGKAQGASGFNAVRGCYDVLQRIDPWLEGARPVRRVAFLYSRASDEYFSLYTHPEPNTEILTHDTDDPRYPFLAQKEVLYYLFRAGVPTDLHYLDQVSAGELEDYETIIVPFPFAVGQEQAAMLESLAASGRTIVVISEFGTVDEYGVPHERPVLLDLLGLSEPPTGEKTAPLTGRGVEEVAGEFTVYDTVTPAEGVKVLATAEGTPVVLHSKRAGDVFFLAGEFGIGLPKNRDNEARDRTIRILPSELSAGHAHILGEIVKDAGVADRLVPDDDIEVSLVQNGAGDLLLFAINWEEHPASVTVFLPGNAARTGTGMALHADGTVSETSAESVPHERGGGEVGRLPLNLDPQEAVVLRFATQ